MRRAVAVILCVGTMALAHAAAQDAVTEISGFRVPEYDENGSKVSEMSGDLAKMKKGGIIEITNLRLEFYEDDEPHTLLTAPACTYDQNKGIAYSRKPVRMAKKNMVVTGTGFAYSRSNELFQIFSDTRVVLREISEDVKIGEGP